MSEIPLVAIRLQMERDRLEAALRACREDRVTLANQRDAALEDLERLQAENRELLCDLQRAAYMQCGCLGGTISHYDTNGPLGGGVPDPCLEGRDAV